MTPSRTDKQYVTYLHMVERLLSDSAILGESTLGHPSTLWSMEWAQSVRLSALETGQPYATYVNTARDHALQVCNNLVKSAPISVVADWLARINTNDEMEIVREGDARQLLHQIIDFISSNDLSPILLWQLAVETSATLQSLARSSELLRHDAELALRRYVSADKLKELLLPAVKKHSVLLGVTGTRDLLSFPTGSHFTRLRSGAGQGLDQWGKAGPSARAFMSRFGVEERENKWKDKTLGPSLYYSVEVTAIDAGAAAETARSMMSPVLDRYVAAHPSVSLTVFDIALVGNAGETETYTHLFGPPRARSVAPLPFQPRANLNPGMLMNAVARNSGTPLAKVAFSWAALESAGMTATLPRREQASKALALLELRQMIYLTYSDTVRGAQATRKTADRYTSMSTRAQASERRLAANAASAPDSRRPSLIENIRRARVKSVAAGRLATLHTSSAEVQKELLRELEVARPGSLHGDIDFAALKDFDKWWEHLRRLVDSGPSKLGTLLAHSVAGTSDRVTAFAHIAHDPSRTSNFLVERQQHFFASLSAMYSARNMYFHTGKAEIPGAFLLARAAPLVTDALLELWLLWDSNAPEINSQDVMQQLAQRYDQVVAELAAPGGKNVDHLNSLTAPVWR